MFRFETGEIVLGALYLRGIQRSGEATRKNWARVLQVLRVSETSLEQAADNLAKCGFWAESSVLNQPGIVAEAERLYSQNNYITPASPSYPIRWLSTLEGSAPPALWKKGELPDRDSVTIVGSRKISDETRSFTEALGHEVVRLGLAVASGGAIGCDRAAAAGAAAGSRKAGIEPQLIEILPYGIELDTQKRQGCVLSLVAPNEEFSRAVAMERNTLLYALSSYAIVAEAKFKEGGAWHGAVAALRRKLSSLIVRNNPDDPAVNALKALGAVVIDNPSDLATTFKEHVSPQGFLFCLA